MPSTRKTTRRVRNPRPKPVAQTAATVLTVPTFSPVAPPTPPETVAPVEPVVEASDALERVRVGGTYALLHRMPLSDVLVHLEAFEDRIAALVDSKAVLDLQPRMRATEGRCAPIYFSGDDDGEPEHLIGGIESVVAATVLGLDSVFVVTVAPGEVGAVQSHLAAAANAGPEEPEDELLWLHSAYAV